jgi:HNH endonuclease
VSKKQTLADWPQIIARHALLDSMTGCIEWQAGTSPKGYGMVSVSGVYAQAHRFAYAAANGRIPAGMHVLHKCDNRKCCNPAHLYIGTNDQNIADKIARDRAGKKLNKQKALEVLDMVAAGISQNEIARRVGIHQCNVSRIASGRRWGHLQTARV